MNIELKNVKHAKFASQETECFTATIYIDGVKAGEASNEGHGGSTSIYPRELEEKLNAYAKTLPVVETDMVDPHDATKKFTYEQSGDGVIDDLLNQYLTNKELTSSLKRDLKRKIVYTKQDAPGIWVTTAAKTEAGLKHWLSDPAAVQAKLKSKQILNLLPFDEALAVYINEPMG